jgi:membrane-associated phospholipid phosphatase
LAAVDRSVLEWFVGHREPWLTPAVQVVTVLGSSAFLIPLVLAGGLLERRRHGSHRALALLAAAYGGGYVLSQGIKAIVARPRPPAGLALGNFSGYAFPSGHATQAAAVYGMLAVVLVSGVLTRRRPVAVWATTVMTVTVVGVTRLYLAAHWLTDVLAGWAVGASWVLLVLAVVPGPEAGDPVRRSPVRAPRPAD